MNFERGQFIDHLHTFEHGGKTEMVSFIETSIVTQGVECDVYKFDADESKDLGVIRIRPGFKTPLQEVIAGDRTIEGYISGKGKLLITKPDGTQIEYSVEENGAEPFLVEVKIGEKMQWQADPNFRLVAYEVCYPPYQDGRFENIPE